MKIKDFVFLIDLKEFLVAESSRLENFNNAKSNQFLDYADTLNEIIEKIKEEE